MKKKYINNKNNGKSLSMITVIDTTSDSQKELIEAKGCFHD